MCSGRAADLKTICDHTLFGVMEGPELCRRFIRTDGAPDQQLGAYRRVQGGRSLEAQGLGSLHGNPAAQARRRVPVGAPSVPSITTTPLPSLPVGWSIGSSALPKTGDAVVYW
jgi:hypothetical protein